MYLASKARPRAPFPPFAPPPEEEPTSLQPLEFSTLEAAPGDRFDAWRAAFSPAFDLRPRGKNPSFRGRHRTWDLGGMAFQVIETDSLCFSSLAEQARKDPLDHWVVSLFVTCSGTTIGDKVILENVSGVPQLSALVDPFHGELTRGRLLLLYVPRDTCRETAHLLDAASLTLMRDGMGKIFADFMLSLEDRVAQLQPKDLPDLVTATRALLMAAIAPSKDRLETAGTMINAALRERARQCVQDNLHNPGLDVPFLLQSLGVSRSRLYRAFEETDGIMRYIQKRRLLAAHVALADPSGSRRIFEVAEDFCFNDAAEFSRAFRREFAYSPSDARALGHHMGAEQANHAPRAQDLGALLRRI
ncbi:helix-turn-helix domain-containing protein [Devosia sediminis]|uniref:Helix-turn-helix transcriptional regulator n=1 Tax=Devosia sediminis TaxID=2798801 RepID=A0A934J1W9_9HYPH|nr:AraC family transcriptional regulator [Devosia sediminis]MBJ3786342.1 helix-turn-helix transcriptional regulator [Devosia sediminis]